VLAFQTFFQMAELCDAWRSQLVGAPGILVKPVISFQLFLQKNKKLYLKAKSVMKSS
jgi:hypothetical protein